MPKVPRNVLKEPEKRSCGHMNFYQTAGRSRVWRSEGNDQQSTSCVRHGGGGVVAGPATGAGALSFTDDVTAGDHTSSDLSKCCFQSTKMKTFCIILHSA